jgi:hypothetical protein
MEILSKSQDDHMLNGCQNYGNNNIFSEGNYKYIFNLKMNKIKEEIKDCVIDKYLNKIIEQNKEINDIKNQLEDLTKKYVNIIKLMINNKNCMKMMDNNNQSFINRYIYKKKDKTSSVKNLQQKKNFSYNNNNYNNFNDKLISIEKKSIEHYKKSKQSKFYDNNVNLEKKKNNRKIYENKENINYNFNINASASNINYLQELNKKDLKKINDIHNILNASKVPKRNLKIKQLQLNNFKNSEINKSIDINEKENKSTLYNKNDLNDKKSKTNKHRNKIKQKINKNCLYFNTEENQNRTHIHRKKFSLNINSGLKDRLFKELRGNYNNFITLNSIEEYNQTDWNENENENKSASNLMYNYNKKKKEHKRFKTFFYQFKKINSSFNESFKDNTSENNLFEDKIKSKFVCNPIFSSFLNRKGN